MRTKPIPLKTLSIILAVSSVALSVQAIPTTITGSVSFSGTSTINGTSFVTATKFTRFEDVFVAADSALTGDYVGTSGAEVTVARFTWAPSTASTPINPLWSFVSHGTAYSFDLSVLHEDYASPTGLLLSGLGTAHITGAGVEKLDTTGRWDFSAQTLGGATFTFSATSTVPNPTNIPDGGSTVAMLGASLLGLGYIGRKRVLSKVC